MNAKTIPADDALNDVQAVTDYRSSLGTTPRKDPPPKNKAYMKFSVEFGEAFPIQAGATYRDFYHSCVKEVKEQRPGSVEHALLARTIAVMELAFAERGEDYLSRRFDGSLWCHGYGCGSCDEETKWFDCEYWGGHCEDCWVSASSGEGNSIREVTGSARQKQIPIDDQTLTLPSGIVVGHLRGILICLTRTGAQRREPPPPRTPRPSPKPSVARIESIDDSIFLRAKLDLVPNHENFRIGLLVADHSMIGRGATMLSHSESRGGTVPYPTSDRFNNIRVGAFLQPLQYDTSEPRFTATVTAP